MTSKRYAEIELGGDESNCLKKPLIMTVWEVDYKGFPELITWGGVLDALSASRRVDEQI